MSWLNEIRNFLEDYSGKYPDDPNIDIESDMGIVGDDFHEMIEKYSKNYNVDMSKYLWYFHTVDEGGMNFGGLFFDPPYKKVQRIPITPNMLAKFMENGSWDVEYPDHEIESKRFDLILNKYLAIVVVIGIIIWMILR